MTEDLGKRTYSRDEVCRLLGVRESVLDGWEEHGLIEAAEDYGFRDLIALRTLLQMRKNRVRPQTLKAAMESLRRKLRDIANPLTELSIFLNGRRVAVKMGPHRMEAVSGQLLLDFDKETIEKLREFPGRTTPSKEEASRRQEAERWFEKGVQLEQGGGPPEPVITAYRRALELEPALAAAAVNLGTVYFHLRKWAEAEEYYRKALESRPDYALANFNLGNLFDELGRWELALEHYQKALELDSGYADAHYNVALLYQTHDEPWKAVPHWRAYLKLDPQGYWAGIARRELNRLKKEATAN